MRNSHTASLCGVLELNMVAFVADLKPAIYFEPFYDLPAIHEDSIHIDTHSRKDKGDHRLYDLAEKIRSVRPSNPYRVNLSCLRVACGNIEGPVNLGGLVPHPALQK